jgi:hypothetical protein
LGVSVDRFDLGARLMNVSPTQRLVNYLREFPPVRPADRAPETAAPRPTDRPDATARPHAADAVRRPPPARPAPATPATADGAPRRLLPRGSLVNIVT